MLQEEVPRFMKLQVDPELSGREMLEELLKAYPEGILTRCSTALASIQERLQS